MMLKNEAQSCVHTYTICLQPLEIVLKQEEKGKHFQNWKTCAHVYVKGCCLKAKGVAATLGSSFCRLFPCLKTFRVEPAENKTWGFTMPDHAPLHEAVLTALSGSSVRELNLLGVETLSNEHHVAIGNIPSLQTLSMPLLVSRFAAEVPHLTFGALPNLKHLTVFSSTESGPHARLKEEISKCKLLETLGQPLALDKGMIRSVPSTLKVLTVGKINFSDLLLLLDRARTSLRGLEFLRADSLGICFDEETGEYLGKRLSKRLAAVPHLHMDFTSLSHESMGTDSFAEAMAALDQVPCPSLTNSIKKLQVEGLPCILSPSSLEKLARTCPNLKEIAAPAACLVAGGGSCEWVQRLGLRLLFLSNCNDCDCLSDFLLPLSLAAQLDSRRTCKLTVVLDGGKESMFQAWENMEKMLKPITRSKVEWAVDEEAEVECNIEKFWDPSEDEECFDDDD
ncbi:hypothetical protein DUNSADRAFT_5640 [Dunaliella salina]|uniref:Uncharacterized protein n=1 Tax=Dunaliella salina TaxID=3046 RepID=A0ABQ7GPW1_DUNSA|nr:hypothetical protein DUNSADRAFT_5640 [Dunaliella salina]|eukprot:KAF5836647.1 hypothetical protein DUNSADRAFT_5640 [Dunaliella salina]